MKKYTPPKKEFLMLPNSVFDMPLDVYAFKIYAYLVCCAGSRGECWPTMNKMSKKLGIAVSTVQDRISQAETKSVPNEQLQFLFVKLRKQLDQHKGKKVYGYLPKAIKSTVNEIVSQLSSEPAIEQLYKEWNKVNREKLSLYYENKDPFVPLVDNKEFRSIKNMIIRAIMEMPAEIEIARDGNASASKEDDSIRIQPRFYPEEATATIPKSAEPPPIVMPISEPLQLNATAVAKGIIGALARLIGDKCQAHRQSLQGQIDHRLKHQINEKKLALGLKTEVVQKASYQTEEEYEQSM